MKSTDGREEIYLFSKGLLKTGMWKFFEVLKIYRKKQAGAELCQAQTQLDYIKLG